MKNLLILLLLITVITTLCVLRIQQMKAVNHFTKVMINQGYSPDWARHVAEVRLFYRPVDAKYMMIEED